ncbi:Nif3-like dinuclear metal center hexameric protein, partial [Rothia mucilaginosa]|uniref:Nif3-like dinuclear metal center hexameric protein n=2 Tax=Rothia TaxID=32207 RepID=UPI00350E51E6
MTEKLATPTLADVVDAFHTLFPPQLAAGWDASGLVAGRGAAKVSTVLFAVDA